MKTAKRILVPLAGRHRALYAHVPAQPAVMFTVITPRHMAHVNPQRNHVICLQATARILMAHFVLSFTIKVYNMKKICFIVLITVININNTYAACTANAKTYTACKPGYYLSGGKCSRCPSSGGTYGTTVDNNTGGITSCYIPSGTSFSDTTGAGTYTGNCYYKN